MKIYSSLVLLAMTIASGATADARFSTSNQQAPKEFRLVYAQVQIGDLSQSDIRRLVFYADRATRTLQDLVDGSAARSIADQDKVNKRFRESIERMAGAGARTGLSMDQVADFYTQNVFDTFGQDFISKLDNFAGGLNIRTLFRNVSTVPASATVIEGEVLMKALADASQELQLETLFSEDIQVVEAISEANVPVALANASAIEVNIVKRVQVINGHWELTVTTGDSLSIIASAIYGDALSYTTIQSANSAVISNPNVIEVGTLLVLPQP